MHVSNFAEIQDWCVGYHGTKTDSSWYPPGNWLPPLPHSSEQPHAADEPNVPSVVHDNAGLRASHDPPRALSLEPIHVQTEVDMDSFCPTDSEQRAHLAVKRVRWADTSDEVTASAFSCAIEVIVGSTPPRSVHGGDGDRAEFAIRACGTIFCGGDMWVETNTACGIVSTHSKHGASMLLCLSIAYHLSAQRADKGNRTLQQSR